MSQPLVSLDQCFANVLPIGLEVAGKGLFALALSFHVLAALDCRPAVADQLASASGLAADSVPGQPSTIASIEGLSRHSTFFRYAIGDRLKITFFEQLLEGRGRDRATPPPLVERTELSGQSVVEESGEVYVPIIGPVSLANLSAKQADQVLIEAAKKVIGGNLKVSVALAGREPVYVLGILQTAGVFKYAPGMVVAQVIALTGGGTIAGGDLWKQLDIERERERMAKATERLKRQLALISVLEAEEARTDAIPSPRLIELLGSRAKAFLRETAKLRELERERQLSENQAVAKLIDTLRADLEISRSRLDRVTEIVLQRKKRRDVLLERVNRRVSPENLLVQARRDLVEIETLRLQLRSSIAQTEYRILELAREHEQARITARIDVEKQLRAAREAVEKDEIMMASIGRLLGRVGTVEFAGTDDEQVSYRIMRRSAEGFKAIEADALTPLRPGDIVRVMR